MNSLLPQPFCKFDSDKWTAATGVPSAADTSDEEIPATEADCPFKKQSSCPVHGLCELDSASDCANQLMAHFCESPPKGVDKQKYYSISGIELPGFDLRGQTLYAEQAREIDLRHFIVHDSFVIARGAIANRLTLANSLFCGPVIASVCQFDERLSLNHSRIEGDVSFDSAELRGGLDLRDADIEGSLNIEDATIAGDLDLTEAEIKGDLKLSGARILGKLKMSEASIGGECDIPEAQIEGSIHALDFQAESIDFDHATIGGHLILSEITAAHIRFRSVHIDGSLNLITADVSDEITCRMLNVEGETRFGELEVGGGLILEGSQFNHLSQIWDSEIDGMLNLKRIDAENQIKIFDLDIGGNLNMNASELGSYTVLKGINIKGELRGDTANATGAITLYNVTVRESTTLQDLAIDEYLRIADSYFAGNCNLSDSRITERIRFVNTQIRGTVIAKATTINQRLYISDTHISGAVQFIESQLAAIRVTPDSVIGGLDLTDSHITDQPLDLADVWIRGEVVLDEAVLERGASIDNATVDSVSMENCSVFDSLTATNLSVGYQKGSGNFEADKLAVEGDADFTDVRIGDDLRLAQASIDGDLTLDASWIRGELQLRNSHLHGEVVAANIHCGQVILAGATLEDDLLFFDAKVSGSITAYKLDSKGDTVNIVRSSISDGIKIQNTDFSGDFVVSRSDVRIEVPQQWQASRSSLPVIQATGTTVKGELLLESNIIHGNVDISEADIKGQFRVTSAKDGHSTIIGGKTNLNDSIIEEQLNLETVHLHGGISATDVRVGSKMIVNEVTGEYLDFSDGFFKWNVNIEKVYTRRFSFNKAKLENEFSFTNSVVSQGALNLQNARVHEAEVNAGYTKSEIDCFEATIESLTVEGFDEETIWNDIKIEKTRFDGFDFTRFTSSLEQIKYRIHYKRNTGPFYNRFVAFCHTLVTRLWRGIEFESSPVPTRNLEKLRGFRDDHLNREITYRRAKDSADSTSDNTAASEFYRLEKKHRRRRRFWDIIGEGSRKLRNSTKYVSNFLLGATAGHGERISRVIFSAVSFLLLFTLMYVTAAQSTGTIQLAMQETTTESLAAIIQPSISYFFFSIASFANIPGTIPETASQSIRFISYVERFIGAAYIPLLVFTLTRSLHR